MTPSDAMREIESAEFCALVNVASGFRTFIRAIIEQSAVKVLSGSISHSGVPEGILERLLELLCHESPEGYEHPWDSALAAYLWILSATSSEFTSLAAESVLQAKRCWWSRKLAERIVDPARLPHFTSTTTWVIPSDQTIPDYTAHVQGTFVVVKVIPQTFQVIGEDHGPLIYSGQNRVTDYFKNQGTEDHGAVIVKGNLT